jgi:poly-gamma-glutamate capsule biosynthesis protein CapA/YwtB (metallophosphatase superfamily)
MSGGTTTGNVTLCAVGDVMPNREEPEHFFDLCKTVLERFDFRFCQLETNFSERAGRASGARVPTRAHPRNVRALVAGGFDLVTYASNHTMDCGPDVMADTLALLRAHGIHTIGAGENIVEARRAYVFEKNGVRVACLNYCSILPAWSWAETARPGVAPLRVRTHYEMIESDQPGCPPRIFTYPHEDDLQAMVNDIAAAKSAADVVVVALHWGLHYVRSKLAGYQQTAAHAAVDAGADLIVGTHAHILKGVEIYKGRPIFYSLGNFALDSNFRTFPNLTPGQKELVETYDLVIDPEWAQGYPYSGDFRKTLAVTCVVSRRGLERVSLLPATITKDARPRFLDKSEDAFGELVQYMTDVTAEAGLNAQFRVEGDEVVVS